MKPVVNNPKATGETGGFCVCQPRKGLNVNKYGIDVINKIQQVIHFNSYNQVFFSQPVCSKLVIVFLGPYLNSFKSISIHGPQF